MFKFTISDLKQRFLKKDKVHLQFITQMQLVGTDIIVAIRTYQHPHAANQLITMIECQREGKEYSETGDYAYHVGFRSVWGVTHDNMRSENAKGVALLPQLARTIYSFYNATPV